MAGHLPTIHMTPPPSLLLLNNPWQSSLAREEQNQRLCILPFFIRGIEPVASQTPFVPPGIHPTPFTSFFLPSRRSFCFCFWLHSMIKKKNSRLFRDLVVPGLPLLYSTVQRGKRWSRKSDCRASFDPLKPLKVRLEYVDRVVDVKNRSPPPLPLPRVSRICFTFF